MPGATERELMNPSASSRPAGSLGFAVTRVRLLSQTLILPHRLGFDTSSGSFNLVYLGIWTYVVGPVSIVYGSSKDLLVGSQPGSYRRARTSVSVRRSPKNMATASLVPSFNKLHRRLQLANPEAVNCEVLNHPNLQYNVAIGRNRYSSDYEKLYSLSMTGSSVGTPTTLRKDLTANGFMITSRPMHAAIHYQLRSLVSPPYGLLVILPVKRDSGTLIHACTPSLDWAKVRNRDEDEGKPLLAVTANTTAHLRGKCMR